VTENAVTPCGRGEPHGPHTSYPSGNPCPGVLPVEKPDRLSVTHMDGGVYLNVDFAERRLTPDQARHLAIELARTADRVEAS